VLLNGVGQGSECARTNFRGSKEQNLAVAALDSWTTRLSGDRDNQQHVPEESMAVAGGKRGSGQRGPSRRVGIAIYFHRMKRGAPHHFRLIFSLPTEARMGDHHCVVSVLSHVCVDGRELSAARRWV